MLLAAGGPAAGHLSLHLPFVSMQSPNNGP